MDGAMSYVLPPGIPFAAAVHGVDPEAAEAAAAEATRQSRERRMVCWVDGHLSLDGSNGAPCGAYGRWPEPSDPVERPADCCRRCAAAEAKLLDDVAWQAFHRLRDEAAAIPDSVVVAEGTLGDPASFTFSHPPAVVAHAALTLLEFLGVTPDVEVSP